MTMTDPSSLPFVKTKPLHAVSEKPESRDPAVLITKEMDGPADHAGTGCNPELVDDAGDQLSLAQPLLNQNGLVVLDHDMVRHIEFLAVVCTYIFKQFLLFALISR
jgi:hypothetical protein